jgi:hypothetical protein
MKLTITHGGEWGGLIPDVFRSGKLILHIGDEIELVLKDETLKELLGLLDAETQALWSKCQKIAKVSDEQEELTRTFGKIVEGEYHSDDMTTNQKEHLDKIYDAFFEFYSKYWNISIDAGFEK